MSDDAFYSSPCMMADTDPAYHGFLTKEEVVELLSTLLRAERAGVRICVLSRQDAPSHRHRRLLRDIQRDEAASCRGLMESLKILRATPDKAVGDFAEKCLAIDGFDERLRFLNRGQGWVTKRIAEALPKIRHSDIQRQLTRMLDNHRRNIDSINAFLKNFD